MDKITIVLTLVFLFLVHVLDLATNHVFLSLFIHLSPFGSLTFYLFGLLFFFPALLHLHPKCFQKESLRINYFLLLFFHQQNMGRGRGLFIFIYI